MKQLKCFEVQKASYHSNNLLRTMRKPQSRPVVNLPCCLPCPNNLHVHVHVCTYILSRLRLLHVIHVHTMEWFPLSLEIFVGDRPTKFSCTVYAQLLTMYMTFVHVSARAGIRIVFHRFESRCRQRILQIFRGVILERLYVVYYEHTTKLSSNDS